MAHEGSGQEPLRTTAPSHGRLRLFQREEAAGDAATSRLPGQCPVAGDKVPHGPHLAENNALPSGTRLPSPAASACR